MIRTPQLSHCYRIMKYLCRILSPYYWNTFDVLRFPECHRLSMFMYHLSAFVTPTLNIINELAPWIPHSSP